MKLSRRKFLKTSSVLGTGLITSKIFSKQNTNQFSSYSNKKQPLIISTWNHGLPASKKSLEVLNNGGSLLDAVELGINVVENDPNIHSVGIGGYPDADGNVTLDSCIMDSDGNAGAVAYLSNIKNAISVARLVKEQTPHMMLAGEGAQRFAINNGFKKENLLTEEVKNIWKKWKLSNKKMHDPVNDNHDTIGLLALDGNGNISGGVSTSGWAYKIPGRVGDSPIIGASLFVDNNVGAACSTGFGEAVMETVGSFLIVEKMREGFSPLEACKIAIRRLSKYENIDNFQVGYIALNKEGDYAGYSYFNGFEYATVTNEFNEITKSKYWRYR